MRSPVFAMLWENWRLTRIEAVQRLSIGLVGTSAFLLNSGASGTTQAVWILVAVHGFFWMSIAKLNGGSFLDGYKPGFPLYLLYTRPVSTASIVGVAMVYDALSCAALYVASAAIVGLVFGHSLPLFSVALWMVSFHMACTCVQWSTRSRVAQSVGVFAVFLPYFLLLYKRVSWPLHVEFSFGENILMLLVCLFSFGLAVFGVARQRCGEALAGQPQKERSGAYPGWLVAMFRIPCPTSSPTGAQLWFELKSGGFPTLVIGVGVALLIFLLFAISIPLAPARPLAIVATAVSIPFLLIAFGSNAFSIRRRHGRAYVSAYAMTQPYDTAQLAALKILVRTACLLVATIIIGASLWASSSLIGAWGPWWMHGADASAKLLQLRSDIGATFAALPSQALVMQLVVMVIPIALTVASFAAFTALRVRYPRPVVVSGSVLLIWSVAIIAAALAGRYGIVAVSLASEMLVVTLWVATAAIVLATIYILWRGIAERALTVPYVCGAAVVSAAFGALWLASLDAAGLQFGTMPATKAVGLLLWPVLLPLVASLLAPWSLHRLRHV